ncbi:hypothetical protein QR674_11215 [Acinetobacter chinensis]|uniref:Lysozyme inhibitor LprI-like N-terminal domain-containing protein n=1 Tax=Acinetobacter chinensis TaxID=2004650 RepID=A0ABU3WHM4_9GAMM|nr:lysozyme inhibitor LprI family protein [Acinetobacter chinensis]MDV2469553.1 hypothetical protein [Acinetobacter chinensis]
MNTLKSVYVVVAGLFAIPAYAASFNCDKAQTETEYAICEHRKINDADVRMATTYQIIKRLVPMGTRGVIQDEQIRWLHMRDQCGKSENCLNEVYKMRQQKLDLYMNRVYQQGPF